MNRIIGTNNRVLDVNLTDQVISEFQIKDADRRGFIGGKGLGIKYLYDRMPPGVDPLGEENCLAFMMGVMMGTGAPCSSRFAAVSKSPLTGIMLSSSCGGEFGMALKTSGYDGLIVSGRSSKPVYLHIDGNDVEIKDAKHLWGKDTKEAQQALNLGKHGGALVIGPAGENKVLFANIASGHRFLGRGGMGAVMGSKNLKAIVAFGKNKIIPTIPNRFKKIRNRAIKHINANHFTGHAYRDFGTSANVNLCNAAGLLPVNNFQGGSHSDAIQVAGETMRDKYETRTSSCKTCTILCGHKGTYPDGTTNQIPEYETVGMMGPNLGVFDTERITEWNNLCSRMGMDTISTGGTLAWAMEAAEKGIYASGLQFGSSAGISEMIESIAHRKALGNELADGVKRLSERYGGADFAMQVKGLEVSAYDPRGAWGQGLSFAVANRGGCHLSATTFALEVFMGFLKPYSTRAKPHFVRYFENLFAVVNSMHTCQFASFAYVLEEPIVKYTPKFLLGLFMQYLPPLAQQLIFIPVLSGFYSSITGIKMSTRALLKAGDRIHTLERWMNTREGISRKDDTLPERFLNEGRPMDPDNRIVPLNAMIDAYYKLRGYDSNGVPTAKTLKKCGIPSTSH